ncbi:MAG: hypothetical protein HYZ47_05070 [Simkania negevensis]|nr:hypothetical protein [Simkania negevensis]
MENFLGAATVARAYGLTWEEIQRGAHKLRPFSHRFEKIEKGGILFIDDTYNAPPASVINALQNLPKPKGKGRKIAVLGAIKVLGSFTEKSHEEVGNVALSTVDMLLCYGEEWRVIEKSFRKEKKEIEFFFTLEEIAKRLEVLAEPGDVVLVKGSNLLKMWILFDLLKIR